MKKTKVPSVMAVKVTNHYIRKARKKLRSGSGNILAECCPIALAAKAAYPGVRFVTPEGIDIGNDIYKHTKRSLSFMEEFDCERPVKPATFRFKLRK